ncbi:uncharacterized protein [Dysidea avara]|uniref:uncharacterized protein n=1 Tax=Dysidea avara TaxID=196820 RepID=UPI0033257DA0
MNDSDSLRKKRVILWAAPRSLSSVFYRSIATLNKTKHFQELFFGAHHFGPVRQNKQLHKLEKDSEIPPGLYAEGVTEVKDLTYEMMKNILAADHPGVELVFSKEFAYCLPESMWEGVISGKFADFNHTFLIREPEKVLYSNYKAPKPQPCIMPAPDGGLHELYKFYQFVKEKKGVTPIVVDAADLQAYPDETMKSYCEAIGITFDPNMTSWGKGFTSPFTYTATGPAEADKWNVNLYQSTGFIKIKPEEQKQVPLHELPSEVVKCIEECHVQYMEMWKDCIKPSPL